MNFEHVNTSNLRLRSWLERPPTHSRLLEDDTEAAGKKIYFLSDSFADIN